MVRERGNRRRKNDRISLLPDYLIHHIFSFLNCKILVQCSILSKKWRYLWTSLPTLNFASPNSDSLLSIPLNSKNNEELAFHRFVIRLLSHRNHALCDVKKLTFFTSGSDKNRLNRWLCFAESLHVQELSIRIHHFHHSLSNSFFTCLLPDFPGKTVRKWVPKRLDSLKSLRIDCLIAARFSTADMLSSCPNLEYLALCGTGFSIVKISLVKLKYLELCYCRTKFKQQEMELSTPKLATLRLDNYLPVLRCGDGLPSLNELELKIISYVDPCDGLPSLNELELKIISYVDPNMIAKQLMASLVVFRNVKSLTLTSLCAEVLSLIPSSCLASNDVLSNLRHLKLQTNKRGITIPSHLLKYLLKGPSLETFVIEYSDRFKKLCSTDDYPWKPTIRSH